jgi:hypothetical protein
MLARGVFHIPFGTRSSKLDGLTDPAALPKVARMRAAHAIVVGLLVLVGCGGRAVRCGDGRPPTPLDHAEAATLTGTVTFTGTPPAMKPLPLAGVPQCAALHSGPVLSGDALVHDGKVENAFVWIKDGLGDRVFAPPETPVTIDQAGCIYKPHVAGAQVCQPIEFLNSDAMLHNVHGTPTQSPPWNFGMSRQGGRQTIRIEKPEVMVPVRCDVHPWMQAFIGVVAHPYFQVTGADGRFRLADLPPGDYVVAAWHERFGTREARVSVGARETKDVELGYAAAP